MYMYIYIYIYIYANNTTTYTHCKITNLKVTEQNLETETQKFVALIE